MNGARANVYIIGLLVFCQPAVASDAGSEQPAMELLEFLGSAEMIDGKWLDPLNMLDLQEHDLQKNDRRKSGRHDGQQEEQEEQDNGRL